MTEDTFRLGNGAGFSGDRVDAPIPVLRDLVAHKRDMGGPAAMFFETLGERTVALAHLEKRANPAGGYEPMLERLLRPILADAHAHRIPLLGNWGAATRRPPRWPSRGWRWSWACRSCASAWSRGTT